jgi:endo-1,4-beta-xylanase
VTPPPTTPPPTTTPPPSGRFEAQLQSVGAGKCITLPSAEIGTIATLATCAGAAGQKLSLPARGTAGAVQLYGATVCLDDFGARGQVGDWVGIYTCAPGTAKQTWTLNAAGELRGINDLCVTVSGFYTTLQTCTGAATQRWTAL